MPETPETRAKLAGAIRELEAKGDTGAINTLVTAYKTKYKTGHSSPQPEKEGSFLSNLVSDPLKTLILGPGVHAGQALGAGILKGTNALGLTNVSNERMAKAAAQPVQFGNLQIEGQKQFGEGGEMQILGDIAKSASYLAPAGKAAKTIGNLAKGKVLRSTVEGATTGALGGALQGFGQGAQEENPTDSKILKGTTLGALTGALAGGTIGLAGSSLANRAAQKLEREISPTNKAFSAKIDEAKKIVNPGEYYTPTERKLAYAQGNVEVQGRGPFKREVVNPKPTTEHEILTSLIDQGKISSKNAPSQNIRAIQQEARKFDSNIDEIVNRPELNKPFNKSMLKKVFDGVENSAKKDLIFVSDSVEERAYKAVMDVAKEEIAQNPLNNSGLRRSIKNFNARMQKILGQEIYGDGSESIANARIQAAKDMRKALNSFLADNLESPTIKPDKKLASQYVVNKLPAKSSYETGRLSAGPLYRSQLQQEAQLLNAADEIAYRASRKDFGKSGLSKFLGTPKGKLLTKVLGGTAIGGAGVATGSMISE